MTGLTQETTQNLTARRNYHRECIAAIDLLLETENGRPAAAAQGVTVVEPLPAAKRRSKRTGRKAKGSMAFPTRREFAVASEAVYEATKTRFAADATFTREDMLPVFHEAVSHSISKRQINAIHEALLYRGYLKRTNIPGVLAVEHDADKAEAERVSNIAKRKGHDYLVKHGLA